MATDIWPTATVRERILANKTVNTKILPAMPRSLRWWLRRAWYTPLDVIDRIKGERHPLQPPRSWIHDGGPDNFIEVGKLVVERQLVGLGGLKPDDAVLDVGCGIGRQAVALTEYLSPVGSYDGIDIVKKAVGWASSHVTPRFPRFNFHHSDIFNEEYNPDGTLQSSSFTFPFADNTFDFVFLTSVFTHMLPDDVDHYVTEIARVLKPGGRCMATFFLLNETSRRLMAEGKSVIELPHDFGFYKVVSTEVPELCIAFDEDWALDIFTQHGLHLQREIFFGGWDGRTGARKLGNQDILVTEKR